MVNQAMRTDKYSPTKKVATEDIFFNLLCGGGYIHSSWQSFGNDVIVYSNVSVTENTACDILFTDPIAKSLCDKIKEKYPKTRVILLNQFFNQHTGLQSMTSFQEYITGDCSLVLAPGGNYSLLLQKYSGTSFVNAVDVLILDLRKQASWFACFRLYSQFKSEELIWFFAFKLVKDFINKKYMTLYFYTNIKHFFSISYEIISKFNSFLKFIIWLNLSSVISKWTLISCP